MNVYCFYNKNCLFFYKGHILCVCGTLKQYLNIVNTDVFCFNDKIVSPNSISKDLKLNEYEGFITWETWKKFLKPSLRLWGKSGATFCPLNYLYLSHDNLSMFVGEWELRHYIYYNKYLFILSFRKYLWVQYTHHRHICSEFIRVTTKTNQFCLQYT